MSEIVCLDSSVRCAWRLRADPAVRFLLAWLVPAFLVFEAIPTKLPHYVLPTYPALAMLIALAIDRGLVPGRRWQVAWLALWGAFGIVLAVVLAYAPTRIGSFAWASAWSVANSVRPAICVVIAAFVACCAAMSPSTPLRRAV